MKSTHPLCLLKHSVCERKNRSGFILVALVLAVFITPGVDGSEIDLAVRDGELAKIIALMKEYPGSVDEVTSYDHSTPLHEAVRQGNIEVVRILIAAKADVNAKTVHGLTPLKLAKAYAKTEIASLLEANGAQLLEPPPKPRQWIFPTPAPQAFARAQTPRFTMPLRGNKELRIINSSETAVSVSILFGNAGADLHIAPGSSKSVSVNAGSYKFIYIFSDDPSVLYQGDNVTMRWNAISTSIQLGAGRGNYQIRRVN